MLRAIPIDSVLTFVGVSLAVYNPVESVQYLSSVMQATGGLFTDAQVTATVASIQEASPINDTILFTLKNKSVSWGELLQFCGFLLGIVSFTHSVYTKYTKRRK